MEHKEKDIDQLFRNALQDAEHEVRPDIWERITGELDKRDSKLGMVVFKPWKRLSYVAAVLLVCGVGFLLFKVNDRAEAVVAKNNGQPMIEQVDQRGADKSTDAEPVQPVVRPSGSEKMNGTSAQNRIASSGHSVNLVSGERQIMEPESLPQIPSRLSETVHVGVTTRESTTALPVAYVTDIGPIQPLVQFEEEEASMYAVAEPRAPKQNIVTTLLNGISSNIDLKTDKELQFESDDEGGIAINVINSLARIRKKRK